MSGDPRFLKILDEMRALHIKKAADYGSGVDPLANLRASEAFGIPAWQGSTIRMNDKMQRLKAFCCNGRLENEGVEDTFMDLACYAILCLVLYREQVARDSADIGGATEHDSLCPTEDALGPVS